MSLTFVSMENEIIKYNFAASFISLYRVPFIVKIKTIGWWGGLLFRFSRCWVLFVDQRDFAMVLVFVCQTVGGHLALAHMFIRKVYSYLKLDSWCLVVLISVYYEILCLAWKLRNILYKTPFLNFILKDLLYMVSKFIVTCEGSYLQNHGFRGHPTDRHITATEPQPA